MLAAFSIQGLISGFTSKISEAWNTVKEFDQKQADLAAIMGTSKAGLQRSLQMLSSTVLQQPTMLHR
jgi:hypothetical protein